MGFLLVGCYNKKNQANKVELTKDNFPISYLYMEQNRIVQKIVK